MCRWPASGGNWFWRAERAANGRGAGGDRVRSACGTVAVPSDDTAAGFAPAELARAREPARNGFLGDAYGRLQP